MPLTLRSRLRHPNISYEISHTLRANSSKKITTVKQLQIPSITKTKKYSA
ncbi:hypothetical protein DSUL_50444 [Desulfovibrionales bacterium]